MRLSGHFLLVCLTCCLATGVVAESSQTGVVDLRDRAFTSQDVVNALTAPAAASSSGTTRKKRGLAVVAADGQLAAPETPPPRRALSIQLQFEFDSARLTDDALAKLDAVGSALQSTALRTARFQVSGHSDAAGRADYNLALSKRRAEAVRTYLVARHGVEAERLAALGKGADDLLDPSDPRSAVNRRVQFETID